MAITKKHLAIQEEKESLQRIVDDIRCQTKEACKKIPPAVLAGDASLAVKWRDAAETAWHRGVYVPDSLSLVAMGKRIGELKATLDFLRAPTA
jgi:hypothetical protein